ncbi:MAG: Hpt domain-containing protein, partial [Anaerolineae bacterium]
KPLDPRALFNARDRWIPGTELMSTGGTGEGAEDYASIPVESALAPSPFEEENGLFGEEPMSFEEMPVEALEAATQAASLILEAPPIDVASALNRFGGDRAFLLELSKEFAAGLPIRVADIRVSVASNDAGALARLAHNLKGVALNFSAEAVGQIARRLEDAGKREDLRDAPELIQQLEEAAQAVREYVARMTA